MPCTPGIGSVDEVRTERIVLRNEGIFPTEIDVGGQGALITNIGLGKMDLSHGAQFHEDGQND